MTLANVLNIERLKAEVQRPILSHRIKMFTVEIHNEIARWPVEGAVTLEYLAALLQGLNESSSKAAARIDDARQLLSHDGLSPEYRAQLHLLGDLVLEAVAYRTDADVASELGSAGRNLLEKSQHI